jgi:hypothetical protein
METIGTMLTMKATDRVHLILAISFVATLMAFGLYLWSLEDPANISELTVASADKCLSTYIARHGEWKKVVTKGNLESFRQDCRKASEAKIKLEAQNKLVEIQQAVINSEGKK